MPDTDGNLYLFEGIELRAEYDARIKSLKGLLPESREARTRFALGTDETRRRPVDSFDLAATREELSTLSAVQERSSRAT
jgi:hypothetical protein